MADDNGNHGSHGNYGKAASALSYYSHDSHNSQPHKPKASERFEVYAWLYMRVSGLLLVLMVLTHFGIMHLYYGVTHIDFSVVAARYATPFWRIYDLVLMLLAVTHGMNGAKMIIDDYIHPRGWRTAVLSLVWAIGFIFLVMGGFTILTFGTH